MLKFLMCAVLYEQPAHTEKNMDLTPSQLKLYFFTTTWNNVATILTHISLTVPTIFQCVNFRIAVLGCSLNCSVKSFIRKN